MKLASFIRARATVAVVGIGILGAGVYVYAKKKSSSPEHSKSAAEAKSARPSEDEKPTATVKTLAPTDLFDSMIFPGVVRSDGVVAVTTFSEGLVTKCNVQLGRAVSKGQTLCSIENDNPSGTYLPHAVDAPVSGLVGEIHVTVGTRVNKGDKIVTLLRSSQAKVELEVPVQDAARLKVGSEGQWSPSATASQSSPAPKPVLMRISGISPLPNMTTRTVKIELTPVNGSAGAPGSMGTITFTFNKRLGLEVAEDALQYRGTQAFLRTVVENKVYWKQVTLGRTQKEKVEILSGVKAGDVVVTETNKFLADGDEVIVKADTFAKK